MSGSLSTLMTVDSSMDELMAVMPGARRAIFAKYHLGGCSSCAFDGGETLRDLCARAELDASEVLAHLQASDRHDQTMLMAAEDVANLRNNNSNLRLFDVRTREEFDAVKIPNAEFFTQDLQQSFFAGDKSSPVVLYDHQGKGVLDQVAWFRGHGFHKAYGLAGGIDAWSREVDPSVMRYRLEL